MATLEQKVAAENKARELLESEGLPEPSRVEYGHTCIRLFWDESQLCLVIDIDEPPEGFEPVGQPLEEYVDGLSED
jgi:hypothetical protein